MFEASLRGTKQSPRKLLFRDCFVARNDGVFNHSHSSMPENNLMPKIKYLLLTIILFCHLFSFAQNAKIDSLKTVLTNCKTDSSKIKILNAISNITRNTNIDSATYLNLKTLELSEKANWKPGLLESESDLGKDNYLKGDYPKSLDYFFKALKISDELNSLKSKADILKNIGNIYVLEQDFPKALEKYFIALGISEKLNDKSTIANHLSNIGLAYTYKGNTELGLDYLLKSLKLNEELGNDIASAQAMDFIGFTYSEQQDYPKALEYLSQSLKMNEKFGNKIRIIDNLRNIGEVYLQIGKFKEAEDNFKRSLEISESLHHLHGIEGINEALSRLYDTTGRPALAFEHYKKYIAARDINYSEETQKKQARTEMNYEFEKKEAVLKEQQDKERAVAKEKERFQQIVIWSVVIGLLLVIVFAGFVVRSLRTTRLQKILIEEKQREILDSIHYAKRIQSSLLPTEKYIEKNLNRMNPKK